MADKQQPQGLSQRKATEDDVEGHSFIQARDGFARAKTAEGEGLAQRKATEEDDVEGHSFIQARDGFARAKTAEGEGLAQRKATEEDDVEGHSMLLNPMAARELAKARERDVQQSVKRHQFENDARAAKKDQR